MLSLDFWFRISLAVLIVAVLAITWLELSYVGHFYPNISIGGEFVGGKLYDEVVSRFTVASGQLNADGLKLIFHGDKGMRALQIPSSISGLTPDTVVEYFSLGDWEAVVREAYEWGRRGSLFRRIKEQLTLFFFYKTFDFPAVVQKEAVRSLLSHELKNFLTKPVPARFSVSGSGIDIISEKAGEQFNDSEIIKIVENKLKAMNADAIDFYAAPATPFVTKERLSRHLDFVRELADNITLAFSYNGYKSYVAGATLASWLTLKDGDDETLLVNRSKLEEFFTRYITPLVNDPPQNSRFEMRAGKLVEIVRGRAGDNVDLEATAQKIDEVISTARLASEQNRELTESLKAGFNFDVVHKIVFIPTVISRQEPKVTKETIEQYEIQNLVALARTSFRGSSADRKHNIEVGVSKLNGMLIAPNEEFSAVEAIGETTEEAGFVPEYVIKGDRSIKEIGGGLCQIATTLFRLALNAGLPITERQNHRYVVSYYGPGLDATIYGPKPDLKFVNDTGNYLLLQGRVVGDEVVFEFYGKKDGRTVSISEPTLSNRIPAPDTKYVAAPDLLFGTNQCSETPRAGITAEVEYKVQYPSGETREQIFKSIYQPWQKICLIGIKI